MLIGDWLLEFGWRALWEKEREDKHLLPNSDWRQEFDQFLEENTKYWRSKAPSRKASAGKVLIEGNVSPGVQFWHACIGTYISTLSIKSGTRVIGRCQGLRRAMLLAYRKLEDTRYS